MSLTAFVHLTPLLTSTAYLQFAFDETFFFSLFLCPRHSAPATALLPSRLLAFSRPAILIISTILGMQLLASLAAVALSGSAPSRWYWAGFVLTLAHFPFAPWAAPKIVDITKMNVDGGKGREEAVKEKMQAFLRVHLWRTLTVNLGAWVCFAIAVMRRMG